MTASVKKAMTREIDDIRPKLEEISDYIYKNPEMGMEEEKAVKILTSELAEEGFEIELGIAGLNTAFKAAYGKKENETDPVIGILAEYDALPEGHACGHNLIAAMSLGAAISLKRHFNNFKGRLEVYGTPAEETDGAKVTMAEKGVFDHLDAALMAHPGDKNMILGSSLAIDALEFTFHGKSAHAAAAPHEGINALDAVICFFNNINALRQQLTDDVRIHGIISEGGSAPNIIPKKTAAKFYIRALERDHLNTVVEKVLNCAQGAATATGCKVEYDNFELSFDNMVNNHVIAELFKNNLRYLGVEIYQPSASSGSTDMGNVSHVTPSIHPYIAIGKGSIPAHTDEFLKAAGSKEGKDGMMIGAKALALTVVDLLSDPNKIELTKKEFQNYFEQEKSE